MPAWPPVGWLDGQALPVPCPSHAPCASPPRPREVGGAGGEETQPSQAPRGRGQSSSRCLLPTVASWGPSSLCQTPVHPAGPRPGGLEGDSSAEAWGRGKGQARSLGKAGDEKSPPLTHGYSHAGVCPTNRLLFL